jgi:predicted nucleotidyltransferase
MVITNTEIKRILREYEKALMPEISVKKVLLFGSYATGLANIHSDLDVGVVIERIPDKTRVDITSRLFQIAWKVNPMIEPKCIYWDEYINPDPASIMSKIVSTAVTL